MQPFVTSLDPEYLVPYSQLHLTIGNLHLPTSAAAHEAQSLLHGHIVKFAHENNITSPLPISLEGLTMKKIGGRAGARVIFATAKDMSEAPCTIVETRYGKPSNQRPWGSNVVAFPAAAMLKSSVGSVDLGLAAIERVKLSKRGRQYPISDRNKCVATFQVCKSD
ncbi:hypothetical protein DM01DRAFT_1382560 [Hesseltinella vesiculosa]|uniref:A-kinase anchor protein 7-like phosphoesterase domain-containing protein n=1 Tax=Hesseltinella vesiculosa TaxID=101127 RepID=A0A1X2GL85_9FUNG|nr:hypothetical protein DM01DRAFT_1382560 [Hesseltinella vesiculosa]